MHRAPHPRVLPAAGHPGHHPLLRTERPARRFDRAAYRRRNRVERLVGRLKPGQRVATRYEKRAVHFLAMVTLAAALLWL